MDHDRKGNTSFNGLSRHSVDSQHEKKRRNYKLIVDPMLRGGGQKLYRFEGLDPMDNRPIHVRDPRSRLTRLWSKKLPADLPIPRFKYDEHYVGEPPPNEVTFTNLNDNINQDFLENMVKVYGSVEEVNIYYNPKNKKHLGVGKVMFLSSKSAKQCADKLNQSSKMGNVMTVFVDAGGKERQKIVDDMVSDKPKTAAPVSVPPPVLTDPRRNRRLSSSSSFPTLKSASSIQSDFSTSIQSQPSFDAYDPEAYDPEFEYSLTQPPPHLPTQPPPPLPTPPIYASSEKSFSSSQTDLGYGSGTPMSNYSHDSYNKGYDMPSNTPSGSFYPGANHNQFGMSQNHGNGGANSGYGFQQQQPPPPLPPQPPHQPPPHLPSHPPPLLPSHPPPHLPPHQPHPAPLHQNQSHPAPLHQNQSHHMPYNNSENQYSSNQDIDRYPSDPRHRGGNHHRNRQNSEGGARGDHRNRDWRRDRDHRHSRDSRDHRDRGDNRMGERDGYNREPQRDRFNRRSNDRDNDRSNSRERNHHDRFNRDMREPKRGGPSGGKDRMDVRVGGGKDRMDGRGERDGGRFRHRQESAEKSMEREKPPPLPPKPKTPEPEPVHEEEPRSMSLESRIQSLLQNAMGEGFGSPSSDSTSDSRKKEPTPPPSRWEKPVSVSGPRTPEPPEAPRVPPIPVVDQTATPYNHLSHFSTPRDSGPHDTPDFRPHGTPDFRDVNSVQGSVNGNINISVPPPSFHPANIPGIPDLYNNLQPSQDLGTPTMSQETVQDTKSASDDDDRMSISSGGSGDQNIEVNPLLHPSGDVPSQTPLVNTNFMSPNTSQPTPWQTGSYNYGFNCGQITDTSGYNVYNQNYYHQYMNNSVSTQGQVVDQSEEDEKAEKTFAAVLDGCIKELKQIMQKDMCKKMVENSAFKSFDGWWNNEEQRHKLLPQKTVLEKVTEKTSSVKPTVTVGKKEVSSTIASLFESQHPWTKEGEINFSSYSSSMGGGFLGIRGGMPRLPSFKRKFRPPSPPPEDEESKGAHEEGDDEAKREEEAGSDDNVASTRASRKALVSDSSDDDDDEGDDDEDEDEEDEDDDEEASAESSEDESEEEDESEASASDSDDEEEEEDEEDATIDVEGKDDEDEEDPIIDVISKDNREEEEEEELSVGEPDKVDKVEKEEEEEEEEEDNKEDEEDEEIDMSLSETEEKEENKDKAESPQPSDRLLPSKEEICDKDNAEKEDSQTKSENVNINNAKSSLDANLAIAKNLTKSNFQTLLDASEILSLRELVQKPSILKETDKVKEEVIDVVDSEPDKEERFGFLAEHDYFAPPVLPPEPKEADEIDSDGTMSADEETSPMEVFMDHNYCLPPKIPPKLEMPVEELKPEPVKEVVKPKEEKTELPRENKKSPAKSPAKRKPRKQKQPTLTDITEDTLHLNKQRGSRELASLLEPIKPIPKFDPRNLDDERKVFFDMYTSGLDPEDIMFLKRTYEHLLQSEDPTCYWINDILWVDHPVTNIPDPVPPRKRRKLEDLPKIHSTGSARTEGFYKLSVKDKTGNRLDAFKAGKEPDSRLEKKAHSSREARHENRRLQTTFADLDVGDLLRFNQLKYRKKQLRFARSDIHDWGLFALEPIAADEMVIEYVGQGVRQSVADLREKKYEADGIGSSYMFRVDAETIIDATKSGNLARFINHCCSPNCSAKVIQVEGQKKIVIYSKRDIDVNEEITYDYKFPIEDEKIPCLCGATSCRGTLN